VCGLESAKAEALAYLEAKSSAKSRRISLRSGQGDPKLKRWANSLDLSRNADDESNGLSLVAEHHCADYKEDYGEERSQGDYYAFVQSVRGVQAVLGAKV
jgi:hypothetical protein